MTELARTHPNPLSIQVILSLNSKYVEAKVYPEKVTLDVFMLLASVGVLSGLDQPLL